MTIQVAFDESGQEGASLFGANELVLAYGSVGISDDTAVAVIDRAKYRNFQMPEVKGATLGKSPAGRQMMRDMLRDPALSRACRITVAFKPFWLVAKLTSLAVDEALASRGTTIEAEDRLHKGHTLARIVAESAFRRAWSWKHFAFKERWKAPLLGLESALRNRDTEAALKLTPLLPPESARPISNDEVARWLDRLERDGGGAFSEAVFWSLVHEGLSELNSFDVNDLEPNLGSLYALLSDWEDEHPGFRAVHDRVGRPEDTRRRAGLIKDLQAKPREAFRFSNGATYQMFAGGSAIEFVDSRDHPAVQLADVLAYVTRYWALGRLGVIAPSHAREVVGNLSRRLERWESPATVRPRWRT